MQNILLKVTQMAEEARDMRDQAAEHEKSVSAQLAARKQAADIRMQEVEEAEDAREATAQVCPLCLHPCRTVYVVLCMLYCVCGAVYVVLCMWCCVCRTVCVVLFLSYCVCHTVSLILSLSYCLYAPLSICRTVYMPYCLAPTDPASCR